MPPGHRSFSDSGMIARIIKWSLKNRMVVLLGAALLSGWGIYSSRHMALDAVPDLSDLQVPLQPNHPERAEAHRDRSAR